jgi:hypothetical protein
MIGEKGGGRVFTVVDIYARLGSICPNLPLLLAALDIGTSEVKENTAAPGDQNHEV